MKLRSLDDLSVSQSIPVTIDHAPSDSFVISATGRAGFNVSAPLGQVHIIPGDADYIGLRIQGTTSQAADLVQLRNVAGTLMTRFDEVGRLGIGGDPTTEMLRIESDAATTIGLSITGAVSQTGNMLEILDSGSTIRSYFDASGRLALGEEADVGSYILTARKTSAYDTTSYIARFQPSPAGVSNGFGVLIAGVNSATATDRYGVIGAGDSSSYRPLILNTVGGSSAVVGIGMIDPTAMLHIEPKDRFTNILSLQAETSQTGDFIQMTDDALTVLTRFNSDGELYVGPAQTGVLGTSVSAGYLATHLSSIYAAIAAEGQYAPTANSTGVMAGVMAKTSVETGTTYDLTTTIGVRGFTTAHSHRGTGTVTGYAGYYASNPTISNGGTITSSVGLYIDTQTRTGVGTGYGIYQKSNDDINVFNGNAGFGGTASGTAQIVCQPNTASDDAIRVVGAVLQTGSLIENQNSSGTILSGFNSAGNLFLNSNGTEDLIFTDAGSTSATEQDWIEVTVGGTTGYIRVYATK